jgi:glycogen(starch) synthase
MLDAPAMTRILVLTNLYPPHHLGGYELSCRDVVERLRARGHAVTVLTTTVRLPGVPDPPEERATGVRRDLRFYWEDHRLLSPPLPRRLTIERANLRALDEAVAAARPEVVSAWNMGAMSLGLLARVVERDIPLVLSVCDEWPVYGPRLDAWTRLFAGRPRLARALRRLTGVPTEPPDLGSRAVWLFVSDTIRRRVEERSRWRPAMASVVYSGIDLVDFPPLPRPDADRPWSWRLMHVGRIDERKGIHVAIDALARLPTEATLRILGRGDAAYLRRLREQASALGLDGRVTFEVVERSALAARYRSADAVVFPTLWEEPFGLVPAEAMACGTPVVATGTGGSKEFLIDGVNCLLVPPGDPAALADALLRLASDPALRARLAVGGLATARELDVERLADLMEAWHVAAAERFARGRPPDRPPLAEALVARIAEAPE